MLTDPSRAGAAQAEATRAASNHIPDATTPTWEMELLISGATVFGLMQLPARLDAVFYDLFNRGSPLVSSLLLSLWLYAKVALLTLIGTFVLHLVLRGLWVAMVGLDSVYPGGIHAGRMRGGPYQRRAAAELPPMAARIETADNRATRVFGVGFGLAMVMVVPFGMVLVGLGIALLGELFERPQAALGLLFTGLACAALPALFANVVDALRGARIDPGSRAGRALLGTFRLYGRLGMSRGANPLLALFQSHEGSRSTGLVIALVLVFTSSVVLVQFAVDSNDLDLGGYSALPDDKPELADVIVPQHYATSRGDGRSPKPAAFIQDRVIRGPYVELFVPLRSRLHGPRLQEECAQAVADVEAGRSGRPALDCLERILDVRLDGAPARVPLDAASDPVSGLRGVMAMIPMAGLAPGRHEVTVARLSRSRSGAEAPKPERILFWK